MGAIDISAALPPDLRPLVVDLDGTLIHTHLAVESFFALVAVRPLEALALLRHLPGSRARFKLQVAERAGLDFHTLPLNEGLVAWLAAEKARGRRIYLASAASLPSVQAMADRLGIFDGVFGSDGATDLAGAAMTRALGDAFGQGGFAYLGNTAVDLDVCREADGVAVANVRAAGWRDYARLARVHHWVKNLLLFVPILAAHHLDSATLFACMAAFASFSLCASGTYVLNDLMDLRSDRRHPGKCARPLASGRVEILHGLLLMSLCLLAAAGIGLFLPWRFLGVLSVYSALTVAYSTSFKRKAPIDVVMLAVFYGLRLVAGGVVAAVPLSPWLLTFSLFLFFSLALVKRCAELRDCAAEGAGDPAGRGYRIDDLPILLMLATAGANVSVLTLALYLNSAKAAELYSRPEGLWLVPGVLLYWIARVLILTHRGEMHQDPVLFAATDRTSWVCLGLVAAAIAISL